MEYDPNYLKKMIINSLEAKLDDNDKGEDLLDYLMQLPTELLENLQKIYYVEDRIYFKMFVKYNPIYFNNIHEVIKKEKIIIIFNDIIYYNNFGIDITINTPKFPHSYFTEIVLPTLLLISTSQYEKDALLKARIQQYLMLLDHDEIFIKILKVMKPLKSITCPPLKKTFKEISEDMRFIDHPYIKKKDWRMLLLRWYDAQRNKNIKLKDISAYNLVLTR